LKHELVGALWKGHLVGVQGITRNSCYSKCKSGSAFTFSLGLRI